MKALVLAAGEGTRLRPLTSNIPKPLLMIAGRPYLSHLFKALKDSGIDEVVLLVGWKSNRIMEYFGDGSGEGIRISYLEQKVRLGTANAIGTAAELMDEDFLCVNGDDLISEGDIAAALEMHERTNATVIGAVEVQDPSRFGVIEESGGKMIKIVEKPRDPPSKLINAGLFILKPDIFGHIARTKISKRGEYEVTDTLNSYAAENDIGVLKLKDYWMDVGRPWDLLKANEVLLSKMKSDVKGIVEPGAVLKGTVIVEEGAIIKSGSYIEGPAYISKNCVIGPNCYIRGCTSLGVGVKVGASVEVKNSVVMSGTHIPHHNYVGDSVIGERCNFGAGTKVANLRFDDRSVKVSFNGELFDTGLRKLGVIMGDDVKTGINSMIEPGTVIWERSKIGVGALAKGSIGPDSWIF
ncbi:MAG: bifunctional sugar-1-phosphate nucleotidylyltransferase/acetyltransferase [Methanomassiliicoccales archaeon]|jgi:bifunctional UDP-N-acetylglucosamine pyrophosphorylase/glucosamine-1-phosphate N-acetyltransferase